MPARRATPKNPDPQYHHDRRPGCRRRRGRRQPAAQYVSSEPIAHREFRRLVRGSDDPALSAAPANLWLAVGVDFAAIDLLDLHGRTSDPRLEPIGLFDPDERHQRRRRAHLAAQWAHHFGPEFAIELRAGPERHRHQCQQPAAEYRQHQFASRSLPGPGWHLGVAARPARLGHRPAGQADGHPRRAGRHQPGERIHHHRASSSPAPWHRRSRSIPTARCRPVRNGT